MKHGWRVDKNVPQSGTCSANEVKKQTKKHEHQLPTEWKQISLDKTTLSSVLQF